MTSQQYKGLKHGDRFTHRGTCFTVIIPYSFKVQAMAHGIRVDFYPDQAPSMELVVVAWEENL